VRFLVLLLLSLLAFAGPGMAQDAGAGSPVAPATAQPPGVAQIPDVAAIPDPGQDPGANTGFSLTYNTGQGTRKLGTAIEVVLLMTLLSMAPAIVMTMTSFTRIVVVLSFLKRAMSMQDMPPALITTGFALFMTMFIMKPVVTDIYETAYVPYIDNEIGWEVAADRAAERMNRFMLSQTREADVTLILDLSQTERPATALETPFHITVPAFILSEVKTAFQMGFVLFLPFVVIDLVISAILVSMGMFTLPPIVVSTPLKLLLFILVGGWDLVVTSLAQSFAS
jgi:flagellar biosynthetic protein FliP